MITDDMRVLLDEIDSRTRQLREMSYGLHGRRISEMITMLQAILDRTYQFRNELIGVEIQLTAESENGRERR